METELTKAVKRLRREPQHTENRSRKRHRAEPCPVLVAGKPPHTQTHAKGNAVPIENPATFDTKRERSAIAHMEPRRCLDSRRPLGQKEQSSEGLAAAELKICSMPTAPCKTAWCWPGTRGQAKGTECRAQPSASTVPDLGRQCHKTPAVRRWADCACSR